jgi:hypothetical protein
MPDMPRDPGAEWSRATEALAGRLLPTGGAISMRVALDKPSGAMWIAPLGTPDPTGGQWRLGYLTLADQLNTPNEATGDV